MLSRTSMPMDIVMMIAQSRQWGQQVVAEQQQVLERKPTSLAPRRPYRPHILRQSAIRRICQLPAESYDDKTEAKVMYLNSNFGKCSLAVCHEDLCPYTEICKKHKPKPKTSITMGKLKSRIAKRSARSVPMSKLRSRMSRK